MTLQQSIILIKIPTMISMVDHLLCHSSVDADVLTYYKSCFIGAKE